MAVGVAAGCCINWEQKLRVAVYGAYREALAQLELLWNASDNELTPRPGTHCSRENSET